MLHELIMDLHDSPTCMLLTCCYVNVHAFKMHGIGTFSMNVPCMLHACYICMSKMDGLHASIGNAHMQACMSHAVVHVCILVTCMPHACNIYDTHTYI